MPSVMSSIDTIDDAIPALSTLIVTGMGSSRLTRCGAVMVMTGLFRRITGKLPGELAAIAVTLSPAAMKKSSRRRGWSVSPDPPFSLLEGRVN